MASNKALITSCPLRKWPASPASLPTLLPKAWAPCVKPNDDLNMDFLAQGLGDLLISSVEPPDLMTSAQVGTSAAPSTSDNIRDAFRCMPMDIMDPPIISQPIMNDSGCNIMFRGEGTMESPFIEIIHTEDSDASTLNARACTKALKKVARLHGFRISKIIWDVPPSSSPGPEQGGPNIVRHLWYPPLKSSRTRGSAFWADHTHMDVYRHNDDIDMTDPILVANKVAIAASVDSIIKNLEKRRANGRLQK